MLKKICKMLKNKKGFSLIELIVVIAILGIIAGLATPSIVGSIINARISADRSNAAQIATAMQRVLAEGGKLEKASKSSLADVDGNIITPLGASTATTLNPTYIQSIPQSQLNPANFKYSYENDEIIIYALSREKEEGAYKYVEIWPNLSSEYK